MRRWRLVGKKLFLGLLLNRDDKVIIKGKNRSLINSSVTSLENVQYCFHHEKNWKVFSNSIATKEDINICKRNSLWSLKAYIICTEISGPSRPLDCWNVVLIHLGTWQQFQETGRLLMLQQYSKDRDDGLK